MLGRIAGYELVEKLGQGGMGVVFKARDTRLDRVVAVKLLLEEVARDAEQRGRFLREARAEASLSHASIATCFDVGEARLDPADLLNPGGPDPHPERVLYLAMEYVPGSDLRALVGDRPLEIPRVLDLAIQIAAGIESAHDAGVIHRDLKPTNIRVTPDGRVKIVDFGLSRINKPRRGEESLTTSEQRVMGTVHYMAPEQARGRTTDPRSDLFSLGVIAYQLVTGRLPFTGDTDFEVANAVVSEDPAPLARYASHVPDELERIVRKLIAKDPGHRYQSAHEVRTDFERLRAELGEPRRRPRGVPLRAAVAATVALIALLAAWGAWQRWGSRPPRTIAVLPFENRSGDPRLDYLGDGMAAGLVTDLVSTAGFNVASLSSAQKLGTGERSAEAVAHELGVQAVVEGTLRRQGGVTYLDVQLVDGRERYVLWTRRFAYAIPNAADIQGEILAQVVRRLGAGVRGRRTARAAAKPSSPSAYDLYLRSVSFLEDPDDPQGPDKALEVCSQALDVDPDFALAWAGRSRALWKLWSRDRTEPSLRMGEEAANRAVQLNPELLEARLARAQIYRATSRYAQSIRELQDILQVNPSWDEAWVLLAASHREAGDLDRAEASLRRAVALRPLYWRNWNSLGALLARRGKYDRAEAAFREVIRLIPEKDRGYENLAAIELKQGNFAEALAVYERLPSAAVNAAVATNMGVACFFERRLAEARGYFAHALSLEPRNHTYWRNLGDLLAREGKADSARRAYTEALRLQEDGLHVDPRNHRLRLDRAVCLAKSSQCRAADTALREILASLPSDDADVAYSIAKLHAVCNRRAEALAALRRAVSLGTSRRLLSQEDEFQALARDPQFRAITRGS